MKRGTILSLFVIVCWLVVGYFAGFITGYQNCERVHEEPAKPVKDSIITFRNETPH